ncbi:MAG: hypothetical protein QOG57_4580, partial [Pseudonocardiales bacterium]|nr:hypothetical protein [Pseudonocardiales bacterium]
MSTDELSSSPPRRAGRWIERWEPENPEFWATIGR